MTTWRPAQPGPEERPPRRVAESLDAVTAPLGGPRANVTTSVFGGWEALVGPEIAAHATPTSLRDGVLVLVVDQPAWATQLRYMTSDLKDRIQAATGVDAVSGILIRIAGERARSRRGVDPPGR
jgi:predicted nucleic acid-binding Zn ribbon protein